MKRKYIVRPCEEFVGLEFLADPPHHRRVYSPGEEVELDDKVHDVRGLLEQGVITLAPKETSGETTLGVSASETVVVSTEATVNDDN